MEAKTVVVRKDGVQFDESVVINSEEVVNAVVEAYNRFCLSKTTVAGSFIPWKLVKSDEPIPVVQPSEDPGLPGDGAGIEGDGIPDPDLD